MKHNFRQRERVAVVSNPNYEKQMMRTGNQKGLSAFNYNRKTIGFQCKKCASDYHIGQCNGLCIDCLQKAEFVLREYPHIAKRVLEAK